MSKTQTNTEKDEKKPKEPAGDNSDESSGDEGDELEMAFKQQTKAENFKSESKVKTDVVKKENEGKPADEQ